MARYIDAQRLLKVIEYWISIATIGSPVRYAYKTVKALIEHQPTADVVEVVRCHNCEYHGIREKCPLLNMSPYRDDDMGYCSEGKRLE